MATYAGTAQEIASASISGFPSSWPRTLASASMSTICSIGADPRDQYERTSRLANPARSSELRASSIAFVRTIAARVVLALHVERAAEPGQQLDAQLRGTVAQRCHRLLEQVHRTVFGSGSPAGVLIADRGSGQELGIVQLTGDFGRRSEGVQGVERLARPMSDRAQLEQDLGPTCRVLDPKIERGDEQRGRLVERKRVGGRACGEDAVVDRPAGVAERHRRREVVGQVRQRAGRGTRGGFPGLADPQVELGPADPREPVVDGAADQFVGEPVGERRALELLDEPAAHRLVERRQELALRQPRAFDG